jgi:hypothetical protein
MLGTEYSILLEPHRAVYIDIAKVASSSIKATLASLLGLNGAGGNPHEIDFPNRVRRQDGLFTGCGISNAKLARDVSRRDSPAVNTPRHRCHMGRMSAVRVRHTAGGVRNVASSLEWFA